jgi:hypothetical protein
LIASFSLAATTVPRYSARWRMMSTDQRGVSRAPACCGYAHSACGIIRSM